MTKPGPAPDSRYSAQAGWGISAEHAVSRILAASRTLDDAAVPVLAALCRTLGLVIAELWLPESDGQSLRCRAIHVSETLDGGGEWKSLTESIRFKPGELLPGIAWASKEPVWFRDSERAPSGPRKDLIYRFGIRGGLAFPLLVGDKCLGSVCLHTRQDTAVDKSIVDALFSLGRVIAQFMLRVQAEDALVESERRFRIAADAAGIGVWDYDIASGKIRWSEGKERMFGLPVGGFDGTLGMFLSLVHPEDRGHVVNSIKPSGPGHPTHDFDFRILRGGKDVRWLHCSSAVTFDPDGRPVRMFGVVTDITAQKRREGSDRLLSEASKVLSSSLDYSETLRQVAGLTVPLIADWCVVNILEPDGSFAQPVVIHSDPAKVRLAQELARRIPPDSFGTLQKVVTSREPVLVPVLSDEMLAAATTNETQSQILDVYAPRSTIIVPLAGGEVVYGTLTLISSESGRVYDEDDLATARELAYRWALAITNSHLYRVLLDSEKRFRGTFENAAAGIAHVNLDGSFLRVNQKLCDLLGYERDDLLNMTLQQVTHPLDMEDELARARQLRAGDVTSYTIEKRFMRRDGSTLWVSKEAVLARNEDGSPDYLIAVMVDISQLKELEESLKQANAGLERRVKERTAELEAHTSSLRLLAARLTQAEQGERKRLAEMIHDDLQQLLVAARMQVTAVQRQQAPTAASLDLAVSLLDQAIDEARSLTVRLRPPALYESGLTASLRWLRAWMENAQEFRVRMDLDEAVEPLTEQDAVFLFDAARELLLNALKYSGTDEATLSLQTWGPGSISMSVIDSGAGFDVSTLDVPRIGNGGFGLFSIKERVLAVGGQFAVRSIPGKGTAVDLLWPRTAPVVPLDAAVAAQGGVTRPARVADGTRPVPSPEQTTLLLVDDHALVRQTLADMLGRQPDVSVLAELLDGEQAIEAVEALRPRIVVMDVNLPRLNGVQATKIIKQRFPDVQVVGLSVHDDQATRQAMLDAGASAYLSKDGPVETLLETVRKLSRLDRTGV